MVAPRPRRAGTGASCSRWVDGSSPVASEAASASSAALSAWSCAVGASTTGAGAAVSGAAGAVATGAAAALPPGSAVAARLALQRLDATCLLHGHERTHGDQDRQSDTDPGPDRRLVTEDREELDDREDENQRAQQGAGHRSRHGQRDVHRRQTHDQPGEGDDRQKPDDESDPAPAREGRIDPELVGEPPDVEVLPWEEEIDEEEHGSHEHQLCSAPEGIESLHAARPFVVVCGGLTGTLMHPGRSCKRERALS